MREHALVFAGIAMLGLAAPAAEVQSVNRDGRSVTFVTCEKCPMRMRFSADGRYATVNNSRMRGVPGEREKLADRAFRMMEAVADTAKGGARRPLMGWSSWNTFGIDISEDIIMSVARAMATNGLAAAGYRYVNIDDGFFHGRDAEGNLSIHPVKFPNGLKAVADGIHALGLKAGIYSDAGADTCGSIWGGGGSGKDPGGVGVGLYRNDARDCRLHFNESGFDFIKVDYCGGQKLGLDERTRYTEISEAIRATGRDVRFNVCRWAFPGTWCAGVAESWRTTGDIRASWASVKSIVAENLYLSAYASPGHFNDMDMLEVGQLKGEVKTVFGKDDGGLTPTEEQTHFGMWCLLSSPLLIGCDARAMSGDTLSLVTNPYLLAMNQNDLGLSAYVAWRDGEAYALVKDADARFGTARFAALYNAGDEPHDFRVPFAAFDLGGEVAALDLAERADIGAFEDELRLTVPAHGARFLRLDAERRLDRTVYEAETAYLNDYQELKGGAEAGTAYPDQMRGASGGVAVRYLGNRDSNWLAWRDVKVSKGGRFKLEFVCSAPEAREFLVQVDGGTPARLKAPATADGAFVSVAWEADIPAGVHEIRVSNPGAWTPDFDRMILKPVSDR